MSVLQEQGKKKKKKIQKKALGFVQKWPWLTYGQWVNIDDQEVERHGECHGRNQPEVAPWGHAHKRLVLRQAVKSQKENEFFH